MKFSVLRGSMASAGMLASLAVLAAPQASYAQAQTSGTRFGVEAAYGDNYINFGVGAFVKFHLADLNARPVTGRVSFDYFFPGTGGYTCDGCGYSQHYFEVNADGLYDITNPKSDIKPYVGAGLTYGRYSESYNSGYCGTYYDCGSLSDSNFGLNILGGINFMSNTKLMPFVEAKFELRSGGEFIVEGGIHFR